MNWVPQKCAGEILHFYIQALLIAIPAIDGYKPYKSIELKGEMSESIPEKGCRLFNRCQFATNLCSREEPALMDTKSNHKVACRLLIKNSLTWYLILYPHILGSQTTLSKL
ncbi:MAG: hypothetical protein QXN35_07020 [Ignisphaera sp.]|uniref:Oligopeptide/dipeptide ABC transporter C-terminal domain-containing protein n=1 Tax=Ignisphaera aggregans TaxID=334771 RepID=A0A7J3I5T9_9CREN